jgi:hypothetical protein
MEQITGRIILIKFFRKQPHLMLAIKHAIFPLVFYFLMFCILTYPLILKFSTHFFTDAGDGLQNVWNLWWINSVILHPDLYPSIWHTNMLQWPFGTTLTGQTLNPFNGFLAVFLLRFLTLTASFNTIIIFAFVMGGVTLYWLSYYLSRSFWGSIIAGFIFTFSNYHFMQAEGHLQLVSLEWIPLFILCWYILITRPSTTIALCTAVALWLVLLCDYYYFFYCILTAILIFLWYSALKGDFKFIRKKDHLLPLAAFVVTALFLTGPIVGSLLITNIRDPLIGAHDSINFSLDLFALVIPGGHWLFNKWTQFYWSKLPGNINESSVYLGLSVYFFMGFIWIKRKTLEIDNKRQIYLWFFTMFFFFILALGPSLHIAGKLIPFSMPYRILVILLPFLELSGMPIRMVVMVILCASILSGMGLRELFRQFPHEIAFISVLLVLLLFETLPKPLPTTKLEVPDYVSTLRDLPSEGGVVDLVTNNKYIELYYQTIHQKPIVFGYVSRLPTSVYKKNEELSRTIENRDYGKLWDMYHIRYVITHDIIQVQDDEACLLFEKVYDKKDTRIYRIGCKCSTN